MYKLAPEVNMQIQIKFVENYVLEDIIKMVLIAANVIIVVPNV